MILNQQQLQTMSGLHRIDPTSAVAGPVLDFESTTPTSALTLSSQLLLMLDFESTTLTNA